LDEGLDRDEEMDAWCRWMIDDKILLSQNYDALVFSNEGTP
jgi:hypothetical protein